MILAPRLRYWRQRRMMTMRELAEAAQVGVTTVNRIEHGKPGEARTLRRLAAALGIEPHELLEEDPGKEIAAA